MLRSPLSWVGGKHLLRKRLLQLFPPHHTYVEVFGGAGWVLFGKDPVTSKSEVLNDLDSQVINFWRVLKHRPAEFSEAASWLLASRELWSEWRSFPGVDDEVVRAIRFYAVIKLGFGAQRMPSGFGAKNYGRPHIWWSRLRAEADAIVARLQVVWIENLRWEECLARYDSRDTFFYLDPPYRCGGSKAYAFAFSDDDHRALAEYLLSRTRGKWLLSYNNDPFLRRMYRRRGLTLCEVSTAHCLARKGTNRVRELLVRNY